MAIIVSSNLKKANSSIPFSVDDQELKGGFRCVNSLAERDAIPVGARRSGMVVRVVTETDTVDYTLPYTDLSNSGWIEQAAPANTQDGTYVLHTAPYTELPKIVTLFGPAFANPFPEVALFADPLATFLKKYYAGYYSADFDIENPDPALMRAGIILDGVENDGIVETELSVILNGTAVFNTTISGNLTELEFIVDNGAGTSNLRYTLGQQPIDSISVHWAGYDPQQQAEFSGSFELSSYDWELPAYTNDGTLINFAFLSEDVRVGWHIDVSPLAGETVQGTNILYCGTSNMSTAPYPVSAVSVLDYGVNSDIVDVNDETYKLYNRHADVSLFVRLSGAAWQVVDNNYAIVFGYGVSLEGEPLYLDAPYVTPDYVGYTYYPVAMVEQAFKSPYLGVTDISFISGVSDPEELPWIGLREFPGVATSLNTDGFLEFDYGAGPITFEMYYGHRTLPIPN